MNWVKCKAEGGEVESLYEIVFHGGAEWWMDMAVALGALIINSEDGPGVVNISQLQKSAERSLNY